MIKPIDAAPFRQQTQQQHQLKAARSQAFTTWLEDVVAYNRQQPREKWLYHHQLAAIIDLTPSSFSKRMHHKILFDDIQMAHLAAYFGKNLDDIMDRYLHEDTIDLADPAENRKHPAIHQYDSLAATP